jgi:Alpha amylase, catalytic domain
MAAAVGQPWWAHGIIYQIYPRSFQDSNGDGIGDLPGIIDRLDYLRWLGVDAIWLSPIYPSPMADFGYDVADFTGVHPTFGTLADFDRLLAQAHARGLKVILDFGPTTAPTGIRGSSSPGRRVPIRSATGTSGAIRRETAGRRPTGFPISAAAAGNGTRRPANTITTRSSRSSRI